MLCCWCGVADLGNSPIRVSYTFISLKVMSLFGVHSLIHFIQHLVMPVIFCHCCRPLIIRLLRCDLKERYRFTSMSKMVACVCPHSARQVDCRRIPSRELICLPSRCSVVVAFTVASAGMGLTSGYGKRPAVRLPHCSIIESLHYTDQTFPTFR